MLVRGINHALDAMEVRDKLDKENVYDLDRSLDKVMTEPD